MGIVITPCPIARILFINEHQQYPVRGRQGFFMRPLDFSLQIIFSVVLNLLLLKINVNSVGISVNVNSNLTLEIAYSEDLILINLPSEFT